MKGCLVICEKITFLIMTISGLCEKSGRSFLIIVHASGKYGLSKSIDRFGDILHGQLLVGDSSRSINFDCVWIGAIISKNCFSYRLIKLPATIINASNVIVEIHWVSCKFHLFWSYSSFRVIGNSRWSNLVSLSFYRLIHQLFFWEITLILPNQIRKGNQLLSWRHVEPFLTHWSWGRNINCD